MPEPDRSHPSETEEQVAVLESAQSVTQRGIVRSLATLCRVLDDIPSIGRSYEYDGPELGTAPDGDDLVISAGGLAVHPRGGWGSRFTTLMYLSADLDQRWGTRIWPTPEEDAPARPGSDTGTPRLRAV